MASLKEIAKEQADLIREGIGWAVIWKDRRSWGSDYIYLNPEHDQEIDPDYIDRAKEIAEQHSDAILVNGYYCGHLGEKMTIDELAAGIAWHYDRRAFELSDFVAAYYANAAHVEQARETAKAVGLPFSSHPYNPDEEPNPYVYDGSMTPEDAEIVEKCRTLEAILREKYPDADPDTIAETVYRLVKERPELADPQRLKWALDHMDELVNVVQRFTSEVIPKVAQAFDGIVAAISNLVNDTIPRLMAALAPYTDEELRKGCNSPKEWHLYKHAKKFRTRKKYMNRFIRRNQKRGSA